MQSKGDDGRLDVMQDLPKIVRDRLNSISAQTGSHPAPGHPDADLLAAFAEHSLPERERARLIQHLANCAERREVLTLAQPPLEHVTAVMHSPGWLSWPVLRWGTVLALAVVVGAAVLLRHDSKPASQPYKVEMETRTASRDHSNQPAVSGTRAKQPAVTETPKNELKNRLDSRREKDAASKTATADSKMRLKEIDGTSRADKIPARSTDELKSNYGVAAPAGAELAAAPPPAPLDKKADQENQQAQDKQVTPYSAANAVQETGTVNSAAPALKAEEVVPGKAKEPLSKSKTEGAGTAVGGSIGMLSSAATDSARTQNRRVAFQNLILPIPRWTISVTGSLERSLDAGKTWQKITVDDHAAFRAVSALGPDVWAGAAGGVLYHSGDAGEHWTRIRPAVNGSSLTADIVSLEFTDTQHGKLTTVNGETWTTTDAGQTWQKN